MGNVPISCCRSRSPRPDSESRFGGENNYSSTSTHSRSKKQQNNSKSKNDIEKCDSAIMQQASQNILQHISEREPDDSETDPSSNPLNRPIFAQRSSSSKNQQCKLAGVHDSYSSNLSSSITRKQTLTPLTSSQDQGYNSGASNNLTLYENGGHLTSSSFESTNIRPINDQCTADFSPQHLLSSPDEQIDGPNILIDTSSTDNRVKSRSTHEIQDDHSNRQHSRRSYLCSNNDDEKLPIGSDDRLKASSCSTIFIDNSTISQPDLDQTIKCVSLAIYYHIRNRSSDTVSEIFDEAIHPLRIPSYSFNMNIPQQQQRHPNQTQDLLILNNNNQTQSNSRNQIDEPDQEIIYDFVRTLFKAAQLTSEYAITTLVYLERLMTYAEMDLTPRSWRRMFLGAILLSSKVWEDQAIWNVDYAQILEEISVDDINELERQFLELIQFNMNVPSSVYAKYYFHLRTLALKNGLTEEQTIMTTGKAKELEAMSNVYSTDNWFSSPIHRKSPPPIKKHTSLEKLRSGGNARAVLM